MRQRDANLTALAAIGPRKKRKVDSPGPGSGTEVQEGGEEGVGDRGAGVWRWRGGLEGSRASQLCTDAGDPRLPRGPPWSTCDPDTSQSGQLIVMPREPRCPPHRGARAACGRRRRKRPARGAGAEPGWRRGVPCCSPCVQILLVSCVVCCGIFMHSYTPSLRVLLFSLTVSCVLSLLRPFLLACVAPLLEAAVQDCASTVLGPEDPPHPALVVAGAPARGSHSFCLLERDGASPSTLSSVFPRQTCGLTALRSPGLKIQSRLRP